jgi:arginine repressor
MESNEILTEILITQKEILDKLKNVGLPKILLNSAECCEYLGDISQSTLTKYINEFGLPVITREGMKQYFLVESINKWLKECEITKSNIVYDTIAANAKIERMLK